MDKKEYIVTVLAGKEVAGIKNPGTNEAVHLTPDQAEHPLRLGHIATPPEKLAPAIPRKSRRGRRK